MTQQQHIFVMMDTSCLVLQVEFARTQGHGAKYNQNVKVGVIFIYYIYTYS